MDTLKPCPFCGGSNVELSNTHTASFWCECECGAQAHGEYFEGPQRDDKFSYTPSPGGFAEADLPDMYPEYQQAARSAIEAWNRRASLPEEPR